VVYEAVHWPRTKHWTIAFCSPDLSLVALGVSSLSWILLCGQVLY